MPIKHGADDVVKIMNGSDEVIKRYHGDDIVYENSSQIILDHVFTDREQIAITDVFTTSITTNSNFLPLDGFKISNVEILSGDVEIYGEIQYNAAPVVRIIDTYNTFTNWDKTQTTSGLSIRTIGSIFYNETILSINSTMILAGVQVPMLRINRIEPNNFTFRITMEPIT